MKNTSAYNVFVKEKHAVFKAQGVANKEIMAHVGTLWKSLSEEQRAPYKAESEALNAEAAKKAKEQATITAAEATAAAEATTTSKEETTIAEEEVAKPVGAV